jgi:hypothetical protein
MLVELNLGLKPGFALMDAVVGMEGPGPGNGYPRRIGLVLASPDVLAMDVVASSIMATIPWRFRPSRPGLPPRRGSIPLKTRKRAAWIPPPYVWPTSNGYP